MRTNLSQDLMGWMVLIPEPRLWIVVSWCIFWLVFFHLMVFRQYRRQRLWQTLEYGWLAVAALSIFIAVDEYRRVTAEMQIPLAESLRQAEWEQTLEAVADAFRLLTEGSDDQLRFSEGWDPQDLAEEVAAQREWLERVRRSLQAGPSWRGWEHLIDEDVSFRRPNLGEIERRKRIIILDRFPALEFAQAQVVELLDKAERSPMERVMMAAGPWLLALALSVRISLTTARLRGVYR